MKFLVRLNGTSPAVQFMFAWIKQLERQKAVVWSNELADPLATISKAITRLS